MLSMLFTPFIVALGDSGSTAFFTRILKRVTSTVCVELCEFFFNFAATTLFHIMERIFGLEPKLLTWKDTVLPLNTIPALDWLWETESNRRMDELTARCISNFAIPELGKFGWGDQNRTGSMPRVQTE